MVVKGANRNQVGEHFGVEMVAGEETAGETVGETAGGTAGGTAGEQTVAPLKEL